VVKRSGPGYLPPVVALGATLAAILVFRLAEAGPGTSDVLAAWLLLLRDGTPLVLAVAWGAALIMARPHRAALVAAAVAIGAAMVLGAAATALAVGAAVAAGLAAGTALGARWRLDAALAVVAGLLLGTVIVDIVAVPLDDTLALVRQQVTPVLEETIPPGAEPAQRIREQERIQAWLDEALALGARLYPLAVLVNLLARAMAVLVLTWVAVRLGGWWLPSWRPEAFGRWRLPFYLVWLLVAGLGLVLMRHPVAVTVGLNVALLAAGLLAVQGLAVQFWVTGRLLSPLGRIVFWTVMGLLLTPLVVASGAVLGLADQWLDLRGLDRGPRDQRGDRNGRSARAADDVGDRDR
jgi:hypothetical protein